MWWLKEKWHSVASNIFRQVTWWIFLSEFLFCWRYHMILHSWCVWELYLWLISLVYWFLHLVSFDFDSKNLSIEKPNEHDNWSRLRPAIYPKLCTPWRQHSLKSLTLDPPPPTVVIFPKTFQTKKFDAEICSKKIFLSKMF